MVQTCSKLNLVLCVLLNTMSSLLAYGTKQSFTNSTFIHFYITIVYLFFFFKFYTTNKLLYHEIMFLYHGLISHLSIEEIGLFQRLFQYVQPMAVIIFHCVYFFGETWTEFWEVLLLECLMVTLTWIQTNKRLWKLWTTAQHESQHKYKWMSSLIILLSWF